MTDPTYQGGVGMAGAIREIAEELLGYVDELRAMDVATTRRLGDISETETVLSQRNELMNALHWLIDNDYAASYSYVPIAGHNVYVWDVDRGGHVDTPSEIQRTLDWVVA